MQVVSLPRGPVGVSALAFLSGGRRLALGRGDGFVTVIAVEDASMVADWWAPGGARSLTAPLDGSALAVAGGGRGPVLLGTGAGEPSPRTIATEGLGAHAIAFSPKGEALAVAMRPDGRRGQVVVWGLGLGPDPVAKRRLSIEHTGAKSLAWSPDGTALAIGTDHAHALLWRPGEGTGPEDHFDPFSLRWRGAIVALKYGGNTTAQALAHSSDGRWLATATGSRVVLWDLSTAQHALTFTLPPGETDKVRALAFAPQGEALVSAHDHSLRFWSLRSKAPRRAGFSTKVGKLRALAWSPDGSFLALGGALGAAVLEVDEALLA